MTFNFLPCAFKSHVSITLISIRAMIFEQSFANNFYDNLLFLSSYWSKTMEREKGREKVRI